MKHPYLAIATFVAAALTACPKPTPSPAPPPDSGDASAWDGSSGPPSCVSACENLRRLGCPEGFGAPDGSAPCETVCRHVVDSSLIEFDVACVAAAPSAAAERVCPGMRHGCVGAP